MIIVNVFIPAFLKVKSMGIWEQLTSWTAEKKDALPTDFEKAINDPNWIPWEEVKLLFDELYSIDNGKTLTELGKDFYPEIIKISPEMESSKIHSALIDFNRIYMNLNRGERIGIWKTSEIRDGFTCVEESMLYPAAFIQGIIKGILLEFGAVGSMVTEVKSKTEQGETFSRYDVAWMQKIK